MDLGAPAPGANGDLGADLAPDLNSDLDGEDDFAAADVAVGGAEELGRERR
jgi:hypothetical protein